MRFFDLTPVMAPAFRFSMGQSAIAHPSLRLLWGKLSGTQPSGISW